MASTSSNFVVPLPPVVKVEVEEQVVPKDFRGYLTRALAWTALMPLFMLAFMHFSQLTHTAAVIDDQQIMRTQQFARSMSARIVSIETFLNTAADMISESIAGSKVIPVSRVQRLAEKMPYITSLKLISEDGKVDFSYGKSDVSAQSWRPHSLTMRSKFALLITKFVLVPGLKKAVPPTIPIF